MGVIAQLTADQRAGAAIGTLANGALESRIRYGQSLILCSRAVLVIQQQAAVHQIVLGMAFRCNNGGADQGIKSISCQFLRYFDFLIGEFDIDICNGQIRSIHGNGVISIAGQVDEVCVTGHGCAAYITC